MNTHILYIIVYKYLLIIILRPVLWLLIKTNLLKIVFGNSNKVEIQPS